MYFLFSLGDFEVDTLCTLRLSSYFLLVCLRFGGFLRPLFRFAFWRIERKDRTFRSILCPLKRKSVKTLTYSAQKSIWVNKQILVHLHLRLVFVSPLLSSSFSPFLVYLRLVYQRNQGRINPGGDPVRERWRGLRCGVRLYRSLLYGLSAGPRPSVREDP